MKIAIGCDHGGYLLKQDILIWLEEHDIDFEDVGCFSTESVDYPIYGEKVARLVASGDCEKGIVICTTGIGISIAANKVKGIRCAHCTDSLSGRDDPPPQRRQHAGPGRGHHRHQPGRAHCGGVPDHRI